MDFYHDVTRPLQGDEILDKESMSVAAPLEVCVWTARPSLFANDLPRFRAVLSPAERDRADRFYFERDRLSFTVAHAVLRDILSRYAAVPPTELEFGVNTYGKPRLLNGGSLQFNLSHSGDVVLVGVTHDHPIGVDVELMRPLENLESLAKNYFAEPECSLIESRAKEDRPSAFFTCWARKESYIKAVGRGLSIPLASFDTSIPEGAAGRRLSRCTEAPAVESWWLTDLTVPPGYAGAITVGHDFERIEYHEWGLEEAQKL
jgi:4'-phosphopantetheinyl transferase